MPLCTFQVGLLKAVLWKAALPSDGMHVRERDMPLTGAVTVNSSPGVVSPPPAQNMLCLIEWQRDPQAHHCDAASGPCWEKGVSLIYLYEAVHNL